MKCPHRTLRQVVEEKKKEPEHIKKITVHATDFFNLYYNLMHLQSVRQLRG